MVEGPLRRSMPTMRTIPLIFRDIPGMGVVSLPIYAQSPHSKSAPVVTEGFGGFSFLLPNSLTPHSAILRPRAFRC